MVCYIPYVTYDRSFKTGKRDFWTDKFVYDALVPVIVILIFTSAIVLTGIGILRLVKSNSFTHVYP